AAGIPTWSPTVVLICRSTAYVWQSGRDAQFSADCGRTCLILILTAKKERKRGGNTLNMAVNVNTSQFLELDVDRRASSPTPGTSLPEDDGMRALRQKMHEIRSLAASTEEKARAMHLLMTRDYITMNNPDHEMPDLFQQGPLCHPVRSNDNPYNITPKDLEPSYCSDQINDEGTGLGCAHYSRNVKVQCFDCNQWHPCRHCHDSSPNLPFPHGLNRKMTQNMLCMLCSTPQPAGPTCTN
ncbi:hypothetical protein KCU63_g19794, partial [Aureobasidium melanogenum]